MLSGTHIPKYSHLNGWPIASLRSANIVVMLLLADYGVRYIGWGVRAEGHASGWVAISIICGWMLSSVGEDEGSAFMLFIIISVLSRCHLIIGRVTCVQLCCLPLLYVWPEYFILYPILVAFILHMRYLSMLVPQALSLWLAGTLHASSSRYYSYLTIILNPFIHCFFILFICTRMMLRWVLTLCKILEIISYAFV